MTEIEKLFEALKAEESENRTLPKGKEEKEEDLIAKQKPLQKKQNLVDESKKKNVGILPEGMDEKENVKLVDGVGEESGASKKTKDGEEKDGIPPKGKVEQQVPILQICVTVMELFGDKSICIVADDAPFDFTPDRPLIYFEVKDKKLVKSTRGLVFSPIVKAPRVPIPPAYILSLPKENRNKRAVSTVTSASLKSWRRNPAGEGMNLQCCCHPSYANENGDHSNAQYCKCAAIAAAIAEQAWNGGKLEDTQFPEGVFE